MKYLAFFSALLLAIPEAVAVPIIEGSPHEIQGSNCYAKTVYRNVKSAKPYKLAPQRASGYWCRSTLHEGCTITESASFTQTVSKSVNGGGSAGLNLGKILSLGLDAGFSYSWSTSDAKGTSASITCPPGILDCGVLAVSTVIKTTGQKGTVYVNDQGHEGCKKASDHWDDFEVVAPELIAKTAPKNQQANIGFMPCLDHCEGKACDTPDAKALPKCDVDLKDIFDKILHKQFPDLPK